MQGRRGGRGRPGGPSRERRDRDRQREAELWKPKTKLGKLVAEGKIKSMHDALTSRLPLREPEIVDMLLPSLTDEVVDINMVQRMTDSGRRVKFAITVVVGNSDGYVGIGREKGKEVGPTIKRAIQNAKLNMIEIKRGCGSWACGCGKPHSLPFAISGKSGSVEVSFKPAPQGTSLAVGDVAKSVMRLAGIKDVWGFVQGHTKTTVNYALATYQALLDNASVRVTDSQKERLKIVSGAVGLPVAPLVAQPAPAAETPADPGSASAAEGASTLEKPTGAVSAEGAASAVPVAPAEGLDAEPPKSSQEPAKAQDTAEIKGPRQVLKKLKKIEKETKEE